MNLLPAWFLIWSGFRIWQLGFLDPGLDLTWLGRDFRIYRDAAVALVAGSDPYAAADRWNGTVWHFAAPPAAAQLFIPFALLPEGIGFAIFMLAGIGLTVAAIRRLRLPMWWILFPPMMEGLGAGNPHVLVLPLLLLGGPVSRALAALLKVYAIAPMLARREWRGFALLAMATVGSLVLSTGAWFEYVTEFARISARLAQEAAAGVSATLILDPTAFGTLLGGVRSLSLAAGLILFAVIVVLVLVAARRDVVGAGWLAVPLLWPAAQYPYATFTMPVARRLSTWVIAIPSVPTYLVGLLVLAYEVASDQVSIANSSSSHVMSEDVRRCTMGAFRSFVTNVLRRLSSRR